MDDHSQMVTERRLLAENNLEKAWYDEVLVEKEYYENEYTPPSEKNRFLEGESKGRCVGEADIMLLDRDEKVMYVEEHKTSLKDASYGQDQLDRIDEHFSDWTVVKRLLVGP